MKNVKKFHLS